MGEKARKNISRYDLFPKISEDFAQRTTAGGIISVVSLIFIVMLFAQQMIEYATTSTSYDLLVDDDDRGSGAKMRINVDLTLHAMHCEQVSLDVMDVTGEQHLDVTSSEVTKRRVDSFGKRIAMTQERARVNEKHTKASDETKEGEEENGTGLAKKCGDCYGAGEEGECCDDCESVRRAYRRKGWALSRIGTVEQCKQEYDETAMRNLHKEGCHFEGHIEVNKVAGNFHISPGKSFDNNGQHVHDLSPFGDLDVFNFSHTIHKISFGEEFPGVVNPLDGVSRIMESKSGTYQYRLQVVPARYKFLGFNARVVDSNEYSVTDHYREFDPTIQRSLPGLFFFYDLSPLRVEYEEKRMGFFKFLSNVAAIVGGVYAVSSIVDGAVYRGQRAMQEKVDLGKQG